MQSDRVSIPNIDRKVFVCLVSIRSPISYIRKKIILRSHNLWILHFRTVYNSSIYSLIFTKQSAFYDRELPLLLFGDMSPISTPSIIMVPINDTPAKLCP